MEIGDKIKHLRLANNLTQSELGKKIGVTPQTIFKYERGIVTNIPLNKVIALAEIFGVQPVELTGWDTQPTPAEALPIRKQRVPLLGNVAAGKPIWVDENHEEYVLVEGDLKCDFALTVKGDSMEPLLLDGDVVFIRRQPDVLDGQIAVVLVEDTATLKVLYHIKNGVQLISKNSAYAPMIYTGPDAADVRILGLAVKYSRKLI